MTDDTMTKREKGVYQRKDGKVWWWQIKAPADLRNLYPTQRAHRCSLQTHNLREANIEAASLRAEWLERFDDQRREVVQLDTLTPEHGRAIAWHVNGHDRDAFLKDVLQRLRTRPASRIEELLPHHWKSAA